MSDELDALNRRWEAIWSRILGAISGRLPPIQPLIVAYNSPQRHYHTLDHIRQCLDEFLRLSHLCRCPDAVELAIWFHDAVYEPARGDNEERSADLAAGVLDAAGASPGLSNAVTALILATRHTGRPDSDDARVLADIDLSILGRPWEEFDRYERAIRLEYAHVEESAFRAGRAAILRTFLGRPSLFQTAMMREKYETAARDNLRRSLEQLMSC